MSDSTKKEFHEHANFNSSFRQFPSACEVELDFAQLLENPDHFLFDGIPTAGGSPSLFVPKSVEGKILECQEKGVARKDVL